MNFIQEVEISRRRAVLEILCKCPKGLRKREISSFTGIWVGDLVSVMAQMEDEGIITRTPIRDMANMEFYDIWQLKN